MSTLNPKNLQASFILLILFNSLIVKSQNSWDKIPKVKNYATNEIEVSSKTYDIIQDASGIIYFANEYGLLKFNGNSWEIPLQTENKSSISALLYSNSKIFIGSNNEIGFAEKDKFNQISYTSLNNKLTESCDKFSLVTKIIELKNFIYFCTDNSFLKYDQKENKIYCLKPSKKINNPTKINGFIYFIDHLNNLCKLNNDVKEIIIENKYFGEHKIKQILPYNENSFLSVTQNNDLLIVSDKKNITNWEIKENTAFDKANICNIKLIKNNIYCINTTNEGIFLIDKNGEILLHLNRDNYLLSNNVINSFIDNSENLWLTLDGSISYIQLNSAFSTFEKNKGIFGSSYDIVKFKNKIFIATSNGVYCSDTYFGQINDLKFEQLEGIDGQVWDLSIIGNSLLIGTHEGSFILKNGIVKKFSDEKGGWNFIEIPHHPNLILQGTYNGLTVYKYLNGELIFRNKIKNFKETSREIKFDADNNIWVSHGHKGIYKLKIDPDFKKIINSKLYTKKEGLPDNLFNSLLDTKDELLFGTQSGVYKYDSKIDSIIPDEKFIEILGDDDLVRKIKKIDENTYLYIRGYDGEDDIGLIEFTMEGNYSIKKVPFQQLKGQFIPAFEKLISLDEDKLAFTTKNGIILYDKKYRHKEDINFKTVVTQVKIKDSIIFGNTKDFIIKSKDTLQKPISFSYNQLKFNYVAPFYQQSTPIKYQTYLEGFDEGWSDWNISSLKEYNFLPHGDYNLRVRAKNIFDHISDESSYKFTIDKPWYKSSKMYLLYFLFTVLLVYSIVRIENKQRRKKIKKLRVDHRKELEFQQFKFEEENLKMKNERMKKDNIELKKHVKNSNQELASSAMQMVQVDNSLMQIKNSLNEVLEKTGGDNSQSLKKVIKSINNQINGVENWKQFEIHFNQIHNNSLEFLKQKYPSLNHREIRLCAYLKLNLSSKEIAPLMGISYRGIESLRFRVRKKMNLETSVNLTDYIINFK